MIGEKIFVVTILVSFYEKTATPPEKSDLIISSNSPSENWDPVETDRQTDR